MQVSKIEIENFRGIKKAEILLPKHLVFIGDNNTGKTTILEALDLVLGPDRLNRFPPIDEHDFYEGKYITHPESGQGDFTIHEITIVVTITNLTNEQISRFGDYIEFWDKSSHILYQEPNPAGVDAESITEAIRVTFIGKYDIEEDDFEGKTYFTRTLLEGGTPRAFSKKDKQLCGFLYLRTMRTGSRALSLERGSLLDIILRLKEIRPQMWEKTIADLSTYQVATDPSLGISEVLESIDAALKKYVPKEWGIEPHLKVSNLTREHLRKVITAFISTSSGGHAAPFYRQGTGTINMLVLAMLSLIAEDKQNVIFAMEEPEIAIPPYAQKRIVHEVRKLSSQAIFTSHSPYVLEEFEIDETVVLSRSEDGQMYRHPISLPKSVKLKRYRQEFRTRFCEGLLSRRIMIAEGATETASLPAISRRLEELNPGTYTSLEALGICTIDAGGETNIPDLAKLYKDLGKTVYSICDKQIDEQKALIEAEVNQLFMHEEKGFEDLVLSNTDINALKRYCSTIETWPQKIIDEYPNPEDEPKKALRKYFKDKKAEGSVADLLVLCEEHEIPEWLKITCSGLKVLCEAEEVVGVELVLEEDVNIAEIEEISDNGSN